MGSGLLMLRIEKVTKLLEVELALLNNPPKMLLPKKLYHNIIYFKYFKGKVYFGFLSTHLKNGSRTIAPRTIAPPSPNFFIYFFLFFFLFENIFFFYEK
jgi:hypothetical protein